MSPGKSDVGWEILNCPNCLWVGTPRPSSRKYVMPCSNCGAVELEISDLSPVNTRPIRSRMRPDTVPSQEQLQQLRGGMEDELLGDRRDRRPGRARRRADPDPPAPAALPEVLIDDLLAP